MSPASISAAIVSIASAASSVAPAATSVASSLITAIGASASRVVSSICDFSSVSISRGRGGRTAP